MYNTYIHRNGISNFRNRGGVVVWWGGHGGVFERKKKKKKESHKGRDKLGTG